MIALLEFNAYLLFIEVRLLNIYICSLCLQVFVILSIQSLNFQVDFINKSFKIQNELSASCILIHEPYNTMIKSNSILKLQKKKIVVLAGRLAVSTYVVIYPPLQNLQQ